MEAKNDIIHFNKKFGLITNNQVVLSSGNTESKIRIESIAKVDLVKYRVLYTNIFLFLFSCTLLLFPTFILQVEKEKILPFILLGIFSLISSIFHKFYFYRLVIKEENNTTYAIKTSQLNRKSIKHFYYSLTKRVKRRK